MYSAFRVPVALIIALVTANLAVAQLPGGLGNLLGGAGKSTDPITLLKNKQVKEELGVTDEQMKKLPEAAMKALADVLDAKQLKRLRQIDLQQQGPQAFLNEKVQTELRMTGQQKESMKKVIDASGEVVKERTQEIIQGLKGGGLQGLKDLPTKLGDIQKEVMEKCLTVLTDSQKNQWKDMTGEEFKLSTGGLGGLFGKQE